MQWFSVIPQTLIKDGTYYRIFTERYLWTLGGSFRNVHFCINTDCIESFRERFPYVFNDADINYDFISCDNDAIKSTKELTIHTPLELYTYDSHATIEKLYKNGSALSLSNLMEECDGVVFKYNLDNIRLTIAEKCTKYIDLTSVIRTLKVRRDLIFQFEILIHRIASIEELKCSLASSLVAEAIELFPLVFSEEYDIVDCPVEDKEIDKEEERVNTNSINLIANQINEKLQGHTLFKADFKQNFLKFSFLNKMGERRILSILLCGDSGIGKTEFAKIASEVMFPEDTLVKINFGNYSTEGVLNSLIGSPTGYVGSEEGGELINKIITSKSRIILIDEFEKATPSVFNFFYELLEDGKFTDRHGIEHDLNGYVIVFTSNMTEKQYIRHIPDSLKSRFDMVYNFEDLPTEDKRKYIDSTTARLVVKLKQEFKIEVDIITITPQLDELIKYKNLRDMKRKIEDIVFGEFLKHYED